MRVNLLWALVGIVVGIGMATQAARAGEPVIGINAGAALPTGDFQKTVDIGGMVAPFVGYRLFGGEKFAFSLVGQPQFAVFSTKVAQQRESDETTLFSFTAGPRLSLLDGDAEFFFSVQGGYYTDISGPLDASDGGFNLAGGLTYELFPGTNLGVFVQRDQTTIHAARGSSEDLAFISTGLSVVHRFLGAPPVVAQAAPPPPPPPPPPPLKKRIVLRGVNFDFNKADIRADARPVLDEAIATLKENSEITIAVEGHTDSVGSEQYNQKLSVRRAKAVEEYLATGGIEAKRMSVEGFGESRPVASNDTDDGRAQNRRVELRVIQE